MEQLSPRHKWNLGFEASYSTNLGLWLIYSVKWCCCNSSQGKLKDFRIWTTCWNGVSFLRQRAWKQSSALYRDRKHGIWQNAWRSDRETPLHHENWDPATQHGISKITLETVPDATHNHNTECLRREAHGSLPKSRYVFFIWKGNFLSNNIIFFFLTVIFLLENILSTFPWDGPRHHPWAWAREREQRGIKQHSNHKAPGCLVAGT